MYKLINDVDSTSNSDYNAKVGKTEDALCSLLNNLNPDHFVSGDNHYCLQTFSFTKREKVEEDGQIIEKEVKTTKLLNLVIDYDFVQKRDKLPEEECSKDMKKMKNLYACGEKLSKANDCQFLVTYISKIKEKDFIIYLLSKEDKKISFVSHDDFKKKIYEILDVNAKDEGTSKKMNDHISNAYHEWIRKKFSSKLVVCDIDALFFNENVVIPVEIKRSDIEDLSLEGNVENQYKIWKNYANDKASYKQYEDFSKNANQSSFFLVILHQKGECNENTNVKGFAVTGVDLEKAKEMKDNEIRSDYYLLKNDKYDEGCYFSVKELLERVIGWLERHNFPAFSFG